MSRTFSSRCAVTALIAGLTILGTFAAGRFSGAPQQISLTCRPSAPTLAIDAAPEKHVALLIGNSQLHDHSWVFPGASVINCAHQGLSAHRGIGLLKTLPALSPDVIIVAFGAVEIIQAGRSRANPDIRAFEKDMRALLASLRHRWPHAEIILAGIPPLRPKLLSLGTAPPNLTVTTEMNAHLARLANLMNDVQFADTAAWLPMDSEGLAPTMTYDGLHLTEAAYTIWRSKLHATSRILRSVQ